MTSGVTLSINILVWPNPPRAPVWVGLPQSQAPPALGSDATGGKTGSLTSTQQSEMPYTASSSQLQPSARPLFRLDPLLLEARGSVSPEVSPPESQSSSLISTHPTTCFEWAVTSRQDPNPSRSNGASFRGAAVDEQQATDNR